MPATAENILADFDATEFTLGDMHVAFRIGEDGYQAAVTERGLRCERDKPHRGSQ